MRAETADKTKISNHQSGDVVQLILVHMGPHRLCPPTTQAKVAQLHRHIQPLKVIHCNNNNNNNYNDTNTNDSTHLVTSDMSANTSAVSAHTRQKRQLYWCLGASHSKNTKQKMCTSYVLECNLHRN